MDEQRFIQLRREVFETLVPWIAPPKAERDIGIILVARYLEGALPGPLRRPDSLHSRCVFFKTLAGKGQAGLRKQGQERMDGLKVNFKQLREQHPAVFHKSKAAHLVSTDENGRTLRLCWWAKAAEKQMLDPGLQERMPAGAGIAVDQWPVGMKILQPSTQQKPIKRQLE